MKEQLLNGSLGETVASSATVGADGSVETATEDNNGAIKELIENVVKSFVDGAAESEIIQLLKKMSPSDKTVDILLIEARCHESLGNHQQALSAAGKLIAKAANHDPWLNDSPRMLAATLGANAAMQLGLSDNALSFYQTVLKFDPEQERARKQYRGLKKVVKMLNKAEEQIQQGYNKKASEHVEDCLSAMRGLDVDSPLFRSKIQLKQCTILSGMGKYEEALDNCDTAVELREQHGAIVSAESRKEAHLVRAEALLLDMDYDEAVSDFRIAFDLVPEDDETGEKRELHHKLQQAMHQQKRWNGGEKDYHYNENTGYPDGRPPERDHAKILQLPIDLENRTKEIKCAWLKKQFKALVRQYHPDKYKGNKKRAARKFKEVKEAKEIISSAWDC
jgi:tetratricopeptide (TPR) repeat protein